MIEQSSRPVPEILAIGCSTGGPQALAILFGALNRQLTIPVVITLHLPDRFTSIMTNQLAHLSGNECKVGEHGETLKDGTIYLAPGDRHMLIESRADNYRIRLSDDPPENSCKPSVDPMFKSLANAYGDKVLALMLSGMGHDGLNGSNELVNAGSLLLAQDEESSVVWGMPGAVVNAGLSSAVVPISKMANEVLRILKRGQR